MIRDQFPAGATLAELEEFCAEARRDGAGDDARPKVTVNSASEIATMTVARRPGAESMTFAWQPGARLARLTGAPAGTREDTVNDTQDRHP